MARPDPDQIQTMADLRAAIDDLDGEIMELLAERLAFIDRAPVLKRREGIGAAAPGRVADVLRKVRDKAAATGFDPDVAEAMWRTMIDSAIAREARVLGDEGEDK